MRPPLPLQRFPKIEAYTLLPFALLILALGSVVYGLAYQLRDTAMLPLLVIALISLTLGWLLARTRLPGWTASLLLVTLGGLLTFFWATDLWGLMRVLWLETGTLIWQMRPPFLGLSADTSPFWGTLAEIKLRAGMGLAEIDLWLRALLTRQAVYQQTAISWVWSLAIWLVSAWAGYMQRRHRQPLLAALPAGLLLTISLGYTYGPTRALFPLIFALLPLTGLTFYQQRERSWQTRGMDYPQDERTPNIIFIFSITIAFVLTAALLPQFSIHGALKTVQTWLNPRVENMESIFESFGLQGKKPSPGSLGAALEGGLPRAYLIGSGPELSDQVVMSVQLAGGALPEEFQGALYWRALTYDHYTSSGWESSAIQVQTYPAGEPANRPDEALYQILQQDIHLFTPHDRIYAAGQIIQLDTDYSIAWRKVPEDAAPQEYPGDFFAGAQGEHTYQVISALPRVSETELHAAQGLYPSWIAARYLALPDNISPRVVDLARELTRNAPTVYGKAQAIEAYLRTYKYELNLPAPPPNRELSDYFLFELQKGYCDYYATSMVVLARTVGLPARMVIGYTRGSYDSAQGAFIVAEDNAHSWAEIYFTGIGWIPFEPTAGQPALTRAEGTGDLALAFPPSLPREIPTAVWDGWPDLWWPWAANLLLGAVLLVLIWPVLDSWFLRCLPPPKLASRLYQRLYRAGSRLGSPARVGDTPYEFAARLGSHLRTISQNSRWPAYLQPGPEEIQALAYFYVRACYSPDKPARAEARTTIVTWRRLQMRLRWARLLSR